MTHTRFVKRSARSMGTVFEIALWGRADDYLDSVAEEALQEVLRLEEQLSFYRTDSDVRELNVYAAERPVYVEPRLIALLERAKRLSEETGGAFDITVAPLMRAWGFQGGTGSPPDEQDVEAARQVCGFDLIEIDHEANSISFKAPGVQVDLGAIGKGYAVEQATEIIRDAEVPGALIHGGTSTVQAVGEMPGGDPWPVAIQDPSDPEKILHVTRLSDSALSVSAVHGKFFTEGDLRYGHVLDPRTGRPVMNALLAAVICESATDSDALSTALLVRGPEYLPELSRRPLTTGALTVAVDETGNASLHSFGIDSEKS